MPSPEDVTITKIARREFNKRQIDASLADIRSMHGVVYVRGVLKAVRGGPADIQEEAQHIARAIRQRPGVRDVVIEVSYRT